MAATGSLLGPLIFFLGFNTVRLAVRWFGIKLGYEKGTSVVKDMAGGALQKITEGASILGLFIMGVLVNRWTSINVPIVVSEITNQAGELVKTTVQDVLDSLLPGLLPLLFTFICMKLLKKKVNAVWLIFGIFAIGIIGYALGWLA